MISQRDFNSSNFQGETSIMIIFVYGRRATALKWVVLSILKYDRHLDIFFITLKHVSLFPCKYSEVRELPYLEEMVNRFAWKLLHGKERISPRESIPQNLKTKKSILNIFLKEREWWLGGNSIPQILKIPLASILHCAGGLNSLRLLFNNLTH